MIYYGRHTIKNTITDKVPLFLRINSVVFVQDTTNITKTRQLNNEFQLVVAMIYRNNVYQKGDRFVAEGNILSIKDYNDDALIDQC